MKVDLAILILTSEATRVPQQIQQDRSRLEKRLKRDFCLSQNF
jgi:hypothetical protein